MTRRPLSILQVGSCFPNWGGTEFHLLNLSEQLHRRGHHIQIACRPGCFVEQEAQSRGLQTLSATCESALDWQDFGVFLSLLRQKDIDLVHVHWKEDYVVAPMAAYLQGVPVVASHHAAFAFPMPLGEIHEEAKLYSRIIALSNSVRSRLLEQGIDAERVVAIHHGTNIPVFEQVTLPAESVRREWGVPEDAFLIGMVGQVNDVKGHPYFLAALQLLQDLPVHGVIVGEGHHLSLLKEMASVMGIRSRLTFAGFRRDVNNAIHALDALVLASTWAEPCAAVVQQAMVLRKPVIGTKMGGTPEMVVEGETGLLVPRENEEAIAKAVRKLWKDPLLCQRMGEAGRKRVEALFDLQQMVDRVEAEYYSILSQKEAPDENTT